MSPCSEGGPKYIQQGLPGSSPSPGCWGNLGLGGEEQYERQGSKGLLQRSPGPAVNDSFPAAKENGRAGGGGVGWGGGTGKAVQAAATSGYVPASVLGLLKKNAPHPPPHHAPATEFQGPEKENRNTTRSASSSLRGREGERAGTGGPHGFRSGGWGVGSPARSASGH